MRQKMCRTVLYSVFVPCLVSLPALGAQSEDPQPMLELHSVGLYDWPVSEKDQRVFGAIKLLRARLLDLAGELELEPYQGQAMVAGWDLLNSNFALRMSFTEDGPLASMVFEPGSGSAENLYMQVTGFADMADLGMNELSPTSSEMMGPMGPIGFAHDESRVWLSMGDGDIVSMDIPQGDLVDGVTPIMSGRIDIGSMIEMFAPEDMLEEIREASGMAMNPAMAFLSPDAPLIEFGIGVTDEQMHMASRLIGLGEFNTIGQGDQHTFDVNVFERVPEDTVRLTAFQMNTASTLSTIDMLIEDFGSDEYAEFSEELGLDIITDILGSIGERGLFYMSDSTGGGGLLSSVLMIEVSDLEAFGDAHMVLVDRLNELAADEARGYVRVQTREIDGGSIFTMTTPGLPIPLEISWAITDDSLIVALSPSSLEVAIAQSHGKTGSSILDNDSFQEAVVSKMSQGEVIALSYVDAPRLAKKGYGMTNLLTSALANAARSPSNPERVVGSLMPSYSSFTTDIAPSGMVSWWDGDDLRTYYTGDSSILVQLSAGLGTIADVQGVVAPALAAGVLLPALGQAKERANELKATSQLRGISQSLILYSMDHDDNAPESLQLLIDQGLLLDGMEMSIYGPSEDGGADIVFRNDDAFSKNLFDARFVVIIDRAMFVNGYESVAVGFADAHVELMDSYELYELLNDPINEGAIELFDLEDY